MTVLACTKHRLSLFALLVAVAFGKASAGQPATILSIEVRGIQHRSERDILGTMELKPGGPFSPEALRQDISTVLQSYLRAGYLKAEVSAPELLYSQDSSQVGLVLQIREGQQTELGAIAISGNSHFDTPTLLNRLDLQADRPLTGSALERYIERLVDLYEENGHPFVRVEPGAFRFNDEGDLDLRLRIDEGPLLRIGAISPRGNETTKRQVIVRETRLRRGEPYRQSKIEGARRRLQSLGYFSDVSPLSIESVRGDTVNLAVDIREGKTHSLNGLIGYMPQQKNRKGYLTGLVDLSVANLLGTGRQMDVFWHRRDPSSSTLSFGYSEPWVWGTPLRLDGHLEQIDQDSTYIQTVARVGLGADLTDRLSGGLQAAWERVIPDSGGGTFLARSTTYTVGARAAYDTRDHPVNPRRGLYYRTSVDYGRKRNRATASFTPRQRKVRTAKFTLDLEHFIPTFSRQTIAVALHGREFRSREKPVPVAEHFRLGGATSLRGFREDQFSGTRLAWASIEYRYLVTSASRLFLFIDVGSYFREQIDPGTEDREVVDRGTFGYGLGFRVPSKAGTIGLDFGLGQGDSFSQGKIHVRLENRF